MKRIVAGAVIAMILLPGLLVPAVASAGSGTDAALGLGAFAALGTLLLGAAVLGGHTAIAAPPPPVVYEPAPVYAPAPPVVYQPAPVYAPAPPVVYQPAPVYAPPPPVVYQPAPRVIYRRPPAVVYGSGYGYRHGYYQQR